MKKLFLIVAALVAILSPALAAEGNCWTNSYDYKVNMRSVPSNTGVIFDTLPNGVNVDVLDSNEKKPGKAWLPNGGFDLKKEWNWVEITDVPSNYDKGVRIGERGWIYAPLLVCSEDADSSPIYFQWPSQEYSPRAFQNICSGKIWNVWTNKDTGDRYLEIGHGDLCQCTIKNKQIDSILSVCTLGKRCTLKVELVPRTDDELSDMDNVFVLDKDKVIWVRPGARNDGGCN